MPTPPLLDTVGQIFQARVTGSLFGQTCITSFDYMVGIVTSAGVTPQEALAAINTRVWDGAAGVGMRNITTVDYVSVSLSGQVIYPTRYAVQDYILTNTHGIAEAPTLPPSTAVVVRKRSLLASHSGRGRWFMPGVSSGFTSGGALSGSGPPAYDTACAQLNHNIVVTGTGGGVTLYPVIFNLMAPANVQFIHDVSTDLTLRQQRRRELGRGI